MRLGLVTVLVLAAASTSASASTLEVTNGVMTYTGATGFGHALSLTESAPGVVDLTRGTATTDVVAATGPGCTSSDSEHFQCTGVTRVVLIGAELNDSFAWASASSLPTTASGLEGNDQLTGADGADTLTGGPGGDGLSGGAGDDNLSGGPGLDTLICGPGADTADGGAGRDALSCNESSGAPSANGKTLIGGPGGDGITGGPGNDVISAGSGSDYVQNAGAGADQVDLGPGDDTVGATDDRDPDVYSGGTGNDTAAYSEYAVDVSLSLDGVANDGRAGEKDNLLSMDNLQGGPGDDTLVGDGGANEIIDYEGINAIAGGGGNDVLTGGDGDDVVSGGDGDDRLTGRGGDDVLDGGTGSDVLTIDGGTDVLRGGAGTDTVEVPSTGCQRALRACRRGGGLSPFVSRVLSLDGLANDGVGDEGDNIDADGSVENVLGGPENDIITGSAAVNVLSGGAGSDLIYARDGTLATDIVSCGTGADGITVDQFDDWDSSGTERCESVDRGAIAKAQPTLTARTTPKSRRFQPYRFVTSGRLTAPGVPARFRCPDGAFVRVWVKAGKRTIASHLVRLARDCSYVTQFSFGDGAAFGSAHALTVRAGYDGGRYLFAAEAKPGTVSVP
ncbi:MAG: calcium-binding protein [Solirubrobacteraceae bacterium]